MDDGEDDEGSYLSAGALNQDRPVSWIVTASSMRILIPGTAKENISYAGTRSNTKKVRLIANELKPDCFVFYDAFVLFGTPNVNQKREKIGSSILPLTAKKSKQSDRAKNL